MRSFELVSQFGPKGDQGQAIDALARGIEKGGRYTLLGVTGSGKSLDFDEPILVRDSKGQIRKVPIGEFVEQNLVTPTPIGLDSFFSEVSGYKVLSFDQCTFGVSEGEIQQVSKHAEEYIYEITLDDYSKIKVTKDHNCFRLNHANLELCTIDQLNIGDYLPTSNAVPIPANSLKEINLLDYNPHVKVSVGSFIKKHSLDKEILYPLLEGESRTPRWKANQINAGTKERSVSQQVLVRILDSQGVRLTDANQDVKIVTHHGADVLSPIVKIDDDFLTFMGLYVAEGHAEEKYVIISNSNKSLQDVCKRFWKNLGLAYNTRNDCDVQYNSVTLANFFKTFGSHASSKKVPSILYNLSNAQLSIFLRSMFDGDGWVEDAGVYYLSASKELIFDAKNLILRFDITTRIRAKWNKKYACNYYNLSITGKENIALFREKIGFSISYKKEKLAKIGQMPANTNVDLFPNSASFIQAVRKTHGFFQRDLATIIRCERSYISMLESGVRAMSKGKFALLADWLTQKDAKYGYLKGLLGFNYRKIVSIEKVKSKTGFVYDLSVKNNENFMAGHGNIFVHNTFSVANVIEKVQRPTLVLCHNKTLAAQLYNEFKSFFPHNSVHYFVSYYDYYQPESYLPGKDVYIEKDAQVNARIEQLRLEATTALLTRKDVIIISSVSCIYGIGDPRTFKDLTMHLAKNQVVARKKLLEELVTLQYERNNTAFEPGQIRVQGDVIDVRFGYGEDFVRIELFGDQIENLEIRKALTGEFIEKINEIDLFPAKHFVVRDDQVKKAMESIRAELSEHAPTLGELERTRLLQRTRYDLEMLSELGYCNGIENYSRHFESRKPGEPPFCLLDYFPKDFVMVIDESHVTIPQVHGMLGGDRSRKKNLIEYGFRLPSAYDNRPLSFEEFEKYLNNVIFTSATPSEYETKSSRAVVEQIVRPTGLVDPQIEVRNVENPIKDLLNEVKATEKKGFRVLVTTLTKKMAEDLTEYLAQQGVHVRYLHSEIDTLERTEIIRQLRLKKFDCLVGINLLREGLDIPEVALVAILDADQEGFLRNARSLIQTIGRAARNSEGRVILYARKTTDSMKSAIEETNRRREKQLAYNKVHKIVPKTIVKPIPEGIIELKDVEHVPHSNIPALLVELEAEMNLAAEKLEFEKAIVLRDKMQQLEKRLKQKQ